MKRILGLGLLFGLFSLPLLAAKNSQVFEFRPSVRIGDIELPQNCKVTWTETSGSQVQLTIQTKGNKTITIPAQMIQEKHETIGFSVTVVNGVRYLKELLTKDAKFIIKDPQSNPK